jgi:hypothetical protein
MNEAGVLFGAGLAADMYARPVTQRRTLPRLNHDTFAPSFG